MATTETAALHQELAAILHEITGTDTGPLEPDTDLRRDLGLDSLSLVELLVTIEHRFGVAVPDELARIDTVGEAMALMSRVLDGRT